LAKVDDTKRLVGINGTHFRYLDETAVEQIHDLKHILKRACLSLHGYDTAHARSEVNIILESRNEFVNELMSLGEIFIEILPCELITKFVIKTNPFLTLFPGASLKEERSFRNDFKSLLRRKN
jgi:hypothetical protein